MSPDKLLRALIGIALFCVGLYGGGGTRRSAGHSARPVRRRDGGRPRLLADDGADRAAAGAARSPFRTSSTRYIAPVQGHHAGVHRRYFRSARTPSRSSRLDPKWATPVTCNDRLRVRGDLLFRRSATPCRATLRATEAPPRQDASDAERDDRRRDEQVRRSVSSRLRSTQRSARWRSAASTNGTAQFHVLRDINLKVMRGERIVICGPSGVWQVDADPLHQPARGAWQKGDVIVVDGAGAHRRPQDASTRFAAKSAWCSSSSICFRT